MKLLTEGELKKRIKDLNTVQLCGGHDLTSGFAIRELEVIDEAKKDFYSIPLWSSVDSMTQEQKFAITWLWKNSVLPKVKKWFGE